MMENQTDKSKKLEVLETLRKAIDYSETGENKEGTWILGTRDILAVKTAILALELNTKGPEEYPMGKNEALEILRMAIGDQDGKTKGMWALGQKSIEAIQMAIDELSKEE